MSAITIITYLLALSIAIPLGISIMFYVGFIFMGFVKYIIINRTYINYGDEFLLQSYQFVVVFEQIVNGINGGISQLLSLSICGMFFVLLLTSEIHKFFKAFGGMFLFIINIFIDAYLSVRIKLIFTKFLYPLVCKVLWNKRVKAFILEDENRLISDLFSRDSRTFKANEVSEEIINKMIEKKFIYPIKNAETHRIQDWMWDSYKYYAKKLSN